MSETVTIGGREFRIGAWYEGKQPKDAQRQVKTMRRQLLAADNTKSGRLRVLYATKGGFTHRSFARSWAAWAGHEVQP